MSALPPLKVFCARRKGGGVGGAMSSAALWVSKALSYAILVGSLIMQAPQIYKILRAKSAKGITTIGWAIS